MASFPRWVSLIFTLSIFTPLPISSTQSSDSYPSQIPLAFLSRAKAPDVFDRMVTLRRTIHENPELCYQEFETSKLIRAELDRLGISYRHPLAQTGVMGLVGSGGPPFVAIRADMDALAMQESVEWEHKSKVAGKMHGCGLDAHVAMLLGAASLLQEYRDKLQGTVVLVFQPAEEGGAGAKKMIEEGALEHVSAIFGLHIASDNQIGSVASRPGPILAASGFFEAVISGKGGDAAIPQHTIDPILAASNVIVSLQHLVSREADPLDSQVVTVGKFQGGGAFNVISDSVTIGGTFRAFSKDSFFQLKERIEEKVAEDLLGPHNVLEKKPLMGAEDFSFYQEVIPGYFFFLGMKNDSQGEFKPMHSPYFRVNEDVLLYGAAFYASLATRYLLEIQPKSTTTVRP